MGIKAPNMVLYTEDLMDCLLTNSDASGTSGHAQKNGGTGQIEVQFAQK